MKIHEYQAKQLFKLYNIPVMEGEFAETIEEAVESAKIIGLPCAVKAQVHSGARGKAGGIKLASTLEEVKDVSSKIIGMTISSVQTAGEEKLVRKVLVEKAAKFNKELYLSFVMDRANECITVIASACGGMDIEEIAENNPDAIVKENIDINYGFLPYSKKNVFYALGLNDSLAKDFIDILGDLYRLFVEKDCSLVEINPLVITEKGKLIALDGKINFDDNAFYKHPDVAAMRDIFEENPLEVEASKFNLNYIKLNGSVGCMVNGAGLAMATMDVVKLAGSESANFLDVGGGASAQNIENAFKLLLSDQSVEMVFVNIFGGILRCDVLAEGIKNAAMNLKIDMPIVVRLEGTNAETGRKILQESGIEFKVAVDLQEAVSLISNIVGVKA